MLAVEKAPPAAALAELKAHLRLEDGVEDALLASWLRAATETVELELGQLLIERGVEQVSIQRRGGVKLTLAPVRELQRVDVKDEAGAWQPVAAGRFSLKSAVVLLSGVADGSEVRLCYRAGIGADWNGLPEMVRQAVVRLAAHFHAHRDSAAAPGIPPAVRQLLAPLRDRRIR